MVETGDEMGGMILYQGLCVCLVPGGVRVYTFLQCDWERGVGKVVLHSAPNEHLPQWRLKNIYDLKNSIIVTALKCKIYCLQLIHTRNFLWGRGRFLATNPFINFSGCTFPAAFGFDLGCLWQCLVVCLYKLLNWKSVQTAELSWSPRALCDGGDFSKVVTYLLAVLTRRAVFPFPYNSSSASRLLHLGGECTPTVRIQITG